MCNLQIRYLFQYNSCGAVNGVKDQLALIEGYSWISIEEYGKKDTKLHTMSGKWKMATVGCFYGHLVEISEEIVVYAYGNPSDYKLEPRSF